MDEASLAVSSAAWDASLSVLKRKTSSMRQSLVVKDERICELERQLAASQLQVQKQGQVIGQYETLEEELRNQVWNDDNFQLKKENVRLKSEEEKWREIATLTKVELEMALEHKVAVESQMKKMQEEIIGLSETLVGSDDDHHDEKEEETVLVQTSQEDVRETGRAVTDLTSPTRYEGHRNHTQPKLKPSSSSCSLVPQKSSIHQAVMNTYPEFNNMLDSQKTTVLWPTVRPLVMEYLTRNEILACRRLTKEGKAAVDKEVFPTTFPDVCFGIDLQEISYQPRFGKATFVGLFGDTFYSYYDKESIEKFMSSVCDTRAPADNPFITRTVSFYITGSHRRTPISAEDYISLRSLLSTYGEHIWRICYNVDSLFSHELFRNLPTFLRMTPNLKALNLFFYDEELDPQYSEFPSLPQLEHLRVYNNDFSYRHLVRLYGPQLTVLECNGSFLKAFNNTADMFLDPTLLTNKLRKLAIRSFYANQLMVLGQVDWNIDALTLEFENFFTEDGANEYVPQEIVNEILATIFSFSKTLVELKLRFENIDFEKTPNFDVFPFMWKLTNLTVKMELVYVMMWLWDFIVTSCGNLREIKFIVEGDDHPTEYRRMAKPLFAKLPKLEKMVIMYESSNNWDRHNVKIVVRRPNTH